MWRSTPSTRDATRGSEERRRGQGTLIYQGISFFKFIHACLYKKEEEEGFIQFK